MKKSGDCGRDTSCVCEAEENIEATAMKEIYIKSSDGNTINIHFLIRQTQHWNTVRSFI